MQQLLEHSWPGNVRELDHSIERAVLMAQGPQVRAADLALRAGAAGSAGTGGAPRLEEMTLEDVERVLIEKALERYGGNVSQAARARSQPERALPSARDARHLRVVRPW